MTTCAADDPCDRTDLHAKGLCINHYMRLRRTGSTARSRRANGTGNIDSNGYVTVRRGGRYVKEHRWVMEEALGRPLLPSETVHHKNGVRHDNRLANLELWVSYHPSGQRVEDLLAWADELIGRYRPLNAT